jgi:periplasmic protein CpxP/Spy
MKKNAIRFLIAAMALAMLSLPALAQTSPSAPSAEGQGKHHGMPSIDERVAHMTKALNLSEDQQTKVKSILTDQRDQMMSLKQDTSTAPTDRRAKFQEIHESTQQKIRDVLTDDQKTKFDQMQERHKEHMMNKGAGQGSTGSSEKQ